ncbi:MAG TPA: protein-glutamate O-methyltransferase CheR [Ohtaekwangia sp.]|uniref:CheR family methyltransferase n=1 Tax=Ohtaekwangia sp. TaxID=2066019 RepID=UPI002F921364
MSNEINDTEYKELLESIRFIYGYDFTDYAVPTVKRRILHFMKNHDIEAIDKLAKKLLKDERFFEEFVQELSITVTEMFRDPSFYKCIRDKVVKRLATYPILRIWIAGCATGQEVYSLAILLKEESLLERSIIYATDINQKSLQAAREGIYPLDSMKLYTNNYLHAGGKKSFSEYYVAKYNSVLFDKSLRENVVFSPHNLAADKSFNEFQLIICRNVLMYFNQHLQNRVVDLFHESLCSFGFLGLGDKESLLFADKRTSFDDIDRREKIYMKVN